MSTTAYYDDDDNDNDDDNNNDNDNDNDNDDDDVVDMIDLMFHLFPQERILSCFFFVNNDNNDNDGIVLEGEQTQ